MAPQGEPDKEWAADREEAVKDEDFCSRCGTERVPCLTFLSASWNGWEGFCAPCLISMTAKVLSLLLVEGKELTLGWQADRPGAEGSRE